MNARSITELTITELPNELQFRAVRKIGWVDLAIWPAVFLGGETIAWMMPGNSQRMYLVFGAVLLLIPLATTRKHLTWLLSVTNQRFDANGYLDQFALVVYIPRRIVVPLSKVNSIGYDGADDRGFYLDCGFWKKETVLPGLNREQALQVTQTILRRFPGICSNTNK